jgi:uncharacterized membrane protein
MSGVNTQPTATITLAPHSSLSTRGAAIFLATVSIAPLGLATLLAFRGMWPILPFAGLEVLALALALRHNLARSRNLQIIRIGDDTVEIETRRGAKVTTLLFTRHWAQVKLRRARTPWHPSQLMIQSHGRACELGSFLTEAARGALAERLHRLIGRVNESPRVERPDCNIKV